MKKNKKKHIKNFKENMNNPRKRFKKNKSR